MSSLKRLLEDPNSPLVQADMKKALQAEIFDKLPLDAVESLIDLLPPADLIFIRAKPDDGPDDKLEVVRPESIDHVNRLKQDPWSAPYISPQVFDNQDFKVAMEDFLVLLSEGYYQSEDEEEVQQQCAIESSITEAATAPQDVKPGRGKRKLNNSAKNKRKFEEEVEDGYKDDQYERYWGERLKKSQKLQQPPTKKRGRPPKVVQ
ncbi:hypothetical protein BDB00DRAFT_827301 [Zychaea mexicana]|uniref:uncharacterized protein n=1 Tax=Zychaea mexicana TaxID=64656 RepID=UPI0022FEA23C|nr:uncharacterized protein BDB00DRAFT_827301 [Zychaea mexicana]KAI9492595.1 hypothetical protein BDB00DRAFT_827301 [Zychaea mexicana]